MKLTAEQKKERKKAEKQRKIWQANMLKLLDIKLTKKDADHGPDGGITNRTRATYAARAMAAYLKRDSAEDFPTLFDDFLNDLRHLADVLALDYVTIDAAAERSYESEVKMEKEERDWIKAGRPELPEYVLVPPKKA